MASGQRFQEEAGYAAESGFGEGAGKQRLREEAGYATVAQIGIATLRVERPTKPWTAAPGGGDNPQANTL